MNRKKRIVVVLSLTAVVGSGAALWSLGAPNFGKEEVFALLRVGREETLSSAFGQTNRSVSEESYRVYKQTQVALLSSPFILSTALREPGIDALSIVRAQDDALNWLTENIRIEGERNSELVKVSLRGKPTDELKMVLTAVLKSYADQILTRERTESVRTWEKLNDSYRRKVKEIEEKEKEVIEFVQARGGSGSGNDALRRELELRQLTRIERRIDRLEEQLIEVRVQTRARETDKADTAKSSQEPSHSANELDAKTVVLTESIQDLQEKYEQKREELLNSETRSVELEMQQQELDNLKEFASKIRSEADRLKISLDQPPRVQILQSPTSSR